MSKHKIGSRWVLKRSEGFAEVIGIYPGGQGSSKIDEYKVVFGGAVLRLDEHNLDLLFEPEEAAIKFFVPAEPVPSLDENGESTTAFQEVKPRKPGRPKEDGL